jgi:TRAP-type C4-dicarboxylate transport system permease small subunit
MYGNHRRLHLKPLHTLAKLCAILAGLLLTVITLMTCISVIGRETVGTPITGDFELSGMAAGAAVALFMPWCQIKHGHIIVDFFTNKLATTTNAQLDRLGALFMAVMMGLLTWRTTLGGLNVWGNQSGTMILGFPEWVVYVAMVPPLALTTVIALLQAACPACLATDEGAAA